MTRVLFVVCVTLIAINSIFVTAKSYKNHKVVVFRIENEEQLEEIQNLQFSSGFVFIDPHMQVNMKLELVIHPENFKMFEVLADQLDIKFELETDDLQTWIDAEMPLKNRKADEEFGFDKYNSIEMINNFLNDINAKYPDITGVLTIGESFEGRPIKGIKIVKNPENPAIFIEANIHAREWISSATAVWIINELLSSEDSNVKNIVDNISWYIIPVSNPDGYEYTRSDDRLWRKTRSDHNILCRGVDPNRNFGFNWRQGGSSNIACTETYAGPAPFSEKEAQALMNFYETIANKSQAYISFHSAAKLLLYPMGHTNSTEQVPNVGHLHDIAEAAVNALKERYQTEYRFGNIVTTLYVASGSSPDHAYGHYKTPLAFTYEFRVGTGTGSGFILPPAEIIPNSEEVLDSLVAMIAKAKELGYFL